ncbi:MAG: Crp/Fnr family transcriptional regulator [Rhodobacteraceae bacterium]|nr:Crp/Fnr family transcriptional regulator [Paracoccaceae bacterium]
MKHEANLRETVAKIAPLPDDAATRFCAIFSPRKIPNGTDVVEAGSMPKQIGFVARGLLRSYYISPKGEDVNKHFFTAGSFFAPLTSLVTGAPSPVYIGALQDSDLLVADYAALLKLYASVPAINTLGRVLVEHAWIGKERRETQLIMLDAAQRYAAFKREFSGLEDEIPQYHIASYLGITPVQLSRIRRAAKS